MILQQLFTYKDLHPQIFHDALLSIQTQAKNLILGSELWDDFVAFCHEKERRDVLSSPLAIALKKTQEALATDTWLYLVIRPRVATWHYLRYHLEEKTLKEITVSEFLSVKEKLVTGTTENFLLEIDFAPFERDFPKMSQVRSIGHGVEFLNRRFSSRLSNMLSRGDELLFSFLRMHGHLGIPFMINDKIRNARELRNALSSGIEYLDLQPSGLEWSDLKDELNQIGFEPGWGRSIEDINQNFSILANLLEASDHHNLEIFLSSIPMIFNLVILSPHGFFGQENVLGLPDTGGQVVYILDQVRALEREMKKRIYNQGLDIEPQILILTRLIPEAGETTCDQPEELVEGTENVRILRIPFRDKNGAVIPQWISRFEIWP